MSFNNASRDEDNTLDQIMYKKQICSDFYLDDLKLYHYTKMHTNEELALKLSFMSSLLWSVVLFEICIS